MLAADLSPLCTFCEGMELCCLAVGGVAGARWEFTGWERVVECGRLDKFLVVGLSRISATQLLSPLTSKQRPSIAPAS